MSGTARGSGHGSIKAVDLFCGVGGLTHGLVRGGIQVAAGVDIDTACEFPFEENNEATFVAKDVGSLTSSELDEFYGDATVRLLAGCAPCQPFSTYSRSGRNAFYEEQWPLVRSFGRLVKEHQPELVTMENVPQLADHPVFQEFLSDLSGYSVWYDIVDCTEFGVPQTRKRLVLMASRLGDRELGLRSDGEPAPTVRDTISSLPAIAAGERDPGDSLHIASKLSGTNLRRIRASRPGGTWRDWDEELLASCHTRTTGETYPSVYGRMEWDKASPTITTQCFGYGNGRFGHPEQDRAISLREAAMLQTFPREYKFVRDGEKVHFSRLGRLIGNAVPVKLGEAIAKALVAHVEANAPQ